MSTTTHYECDAWLVEDDLGSSSESLFIIDIYAQVTPNDSMEEDDRGAIDSTSTIVKQFVVKRDHLIYDNTSWSTIETMLTEMNLPFGVHPIMILKIMECAKESLYMDNKIIPMMVYLRITRSLDNGVSDQALMESFDSRALRFVGASKDSTERLEKAKVEGCSKQCVVCLEDMLIGMEATRMPCSHVYHGSCIKNWLENSNHCPLCRFQIPA